MILFIKPLDGGEKLTLDVEPTATIVSIRTQISELTEIAIEKITLVWCGKQLKDKKQKGPKDSDGSYMDQIIGATGMGTESTIHLVVLSESQEQ